MSDTPEFRLPEDALHPGTTVVQASAGTGKTWTIERIVLERVCGGVPMRRIALMSFTRAAADELAERVRQTLQSEGRRPGRSAAERARVEMALLDFDSASIGTIHAFCQRMLREHAAEAGAFGLSGWELDPDEQGSLDLALTDAISATCMSDEAWARHLTFPGAFAQLAAGTHHALENEAERQRVTCADFQGARAEWRRRVGALLALPELATHASALQSAMRQEGGQALQALGSLLQQAASVDAHELEPVLEAISEWLIEEPGHALLHDEAFVLRHATTDKRRVAEIDAIRSRLRRDDTVALREACAAAAEAWLQRCQAAFDQVVAEAMRRLHARRARRRQCSFQDMLTRLRDALRAPDGAMLRTLRARFDLAILDEFQDTDPVQAEIVHMLFVGGERRALYLVGDPKQSIYGFRSADIGSYMRLCQGADRTRRLAESHRSDPALVQGVQALFSVASPFFHDRIDAGAVRSHYKAPRIAHPDGRPMAGVVLHAMPEDPDADTWQSLVAGAIRDQLSEDIRVRVKPDDMPRRLQPRDIAVLCRANRDNHGMAEALRRAGVPAIVLGGGSVLQSDMALEVLQLLLALSRTGSRDWALAALSTRLVGLDLGALQADPDACAQRIRRAGSVLARHGVAAGLRELLTPASGGRDALLGLVTADEGERHEVDLRHLIELLDAAEAGGVRGATALAAWLADQIERGGDQGTDVRAIAEHDAVVVQTLHGSKGLTYGITWMPTFMKSTRPRKRPDTEAQRQKERETAAEDRRLLYVGLTRARWQSHLVWQRQRTAAASPLATLLHARDDTDALEARSTAAARLDTSDAWMDVRAVAAASAGTVEARELVAGACRAVKPEPPAKLAEAWPVPRVPPERDQVSFSKLHEGLASAPGDVEAADRDDPALARDSEGADAGEACDRPLRDLDLRGAALGNPVHAALEHAQAFAALRAGAPVDALADTLAREIEAWGHGCEPDRVARAALHLQGALRAPLARGAVPSVADAAAAERGVFRELKLCTGWSGDLSGIAQAFRDEPHAWAVRLAETLARASTETRSGLCVGNIDLVRHHAGRWFIYDYKTNDLGRAASDYAAEADASGLSPLDRAMVANHYPLQAALYGALIRRWTAARGAGPAVIGGVAYLFVRGMSEASPGRGVWHWQPSSRLLDVIERCLQVQEASNA